MQTDKLKEKKDDLREYDKKDGSNPVKSRGGPSWGSGRRFLKKDTRLRGLPKEERRGTTCV